MTGKLMIRRLMLWALAALLFSSCSIYDDYPHRRQYDMDVVLTDVEGNVMDDSVASVSEIYAFVNGVYSGKYTKSADGKIHIVLDDRDKVTFVAAGGRHPDEYTQQEPQVGDSISSTWLRLKKQTDGHGVQPSDLFYGSATVGGSSAMVDADDHYTLSLRDIRGKVRVMIRGLGTRFGTGDYQVVLEGLSGGLAYDGSPSGEKVSYDLGGSFVNSSNWLSDSVQVLPTYGGSFSLKVFKSDGTLILVSDHDEKGQPFSVATGDDVVLVVSIDKTSEFTIKIIPFEDVFNSGFFQ